MITIKEIAAELGLSTTTVSNVIHGKTKEVSEERIALVQEALKRHNYIPNISARNLATNRSMIIGVAFIDPVESHKTDAFVGELVGTLESELSAKGYTMLLKISKDIDDCIKTVTAWNVDGLIVFGAQEEPGVNILEKIDKPITFVDSFVGLGRMKRGDLHTPIIRLADVEGGYMAAKHLIANGHRKIAYFTTTNQWLEPERYDGFCRALNEAGLTCNDKNYIPMEVRDSSFEYAAEELLEKAKEYTAFFCYSDYYAMLLMNLFLRHGIRIPEDVSIVGFDDSIYSRFTIPAITTIKQDPSLKCRTAVKNILAQINNDEFEEGCIYIPLELIERESVKNIN